MQCLITSSAAGGTWEQLWRKAKMLSTSECRWIFLESVINNILELGMERSFENIEISRDSSMVRLKFIFGFPPSLKDISSKKILFGILSLITFHDGGNSSGNFETSSSKFWTWSLERKLWDSKSIFWASFSCLAVDVEAVDLCLGFAEVRYWGRFGKILGIASSFKHLFLRFPSFRRGFESFLSVRKSASSKWRLQTTALADGLQLLLGIALIHFWRLSSSLGKTYARTPGGSFVRPYPDLHPFWIK